MTFLSKTLLGLSSITGGCCAIGVPVAMTSNGGQKLQEQGKPSNITMPKCEVGDFAEPSPSGSVSPKSFCWKVETVSISNSDEEELNPLINAVREAESSGMNLLNEGKAYCRVRESSESGDDSSSDGRGPLWQENSGDPCNGAKYLAYKDKYWIKSGNGKAEQVDDVDVRLCLNQCGEEDPQFRGSTGNVLVKEQESNGHPVSFYVKKNQPL